MIEALKSTISFEINYLIDGAPEEIRTPDPQIRRGDVSSQHACTPGSGNTSVDARPCNDPQRGRWVVKRANRRAGEGIK
jgi:hypothetical protein